MPQVGSHFNEFLNYLKDNGVSVRYDTVMPHTLKSSQSDFNPEAVAGMMANRKKREDKPLFVSGDSHIMDGHHRWLARLWHPEDSQKPIRIIRTNNNILDLITMARRFPKTEFRDVNKVLKEVHKYRKASEPIDEMMTLNRHPLVKSIRDLSKHPNEDWFEQGHHIHQAVKSTGIMKTDLLGTGVFGAAYGHKDHVIKVYRHDPAYRDFVDYARANQDNPHLPKIHAHKVLDDFRDVGAVKMERLEPLSADDIYRHAQLIKSNGRLSALYVHDDDIENSAKLNNIEDFHHHMRTNYPGIHNTLSDLGSRISNTPYNLDIHSGNVMRRVHPRTGETTLVLTDPVSS